MVRATSNHGLKASLCWNCAKCQDCDDTIDDRRYGRVVTMCDKYDRREHR